MFESTAHAGWDSGAVVLGRRWMRVDGPSTLLVWHPKGEWLTKLEGSLALDVNRRVRRALHQIEVGAEHRARTQERAVDGGVRPSAARVRLKALAEMPPSADVLAQLVAEDPESLPEDAGVAWLVVHQRCTAWLAARGDACLVAVAGTAERVHEHRVTGGPLDQDHARMVKIRDAACAEIATALHQTRAGVARKVEQARDMAVTMRPLRDALEAGTVSTSHAIAIRDELLRLPITDRDPATHQRRCAAVLADVIPYAERRTPAQTRKRARALVAQIEPVNSEDRKKQAARTHGMWVTDEGDDTSILCSRMPTAQAHHAMSVINALATDEWLAADPADTVDARKVTALLTLLHHGTCGHNPSEASAVERARVTAHVQVVVSADALAGLTDQPGYLDDEVLSAQAIRALVKSCSENSTMRRLLTDPQTGRLLDYGRNTYAVPAALRQHLAARDKTCRFPGCGRSAMHCQVDHATAWDAGGTTSAQNLGHLCTYHHNLKTHSGWRITDSHADGTCTWTSPHGRTHEHQPPPVLPPRPPDPPPDDDPPF